MAILVSQEVDTLHHLANDGIGFSPLALACGMLDSVIDQMLLCMETIVNVV